MCHEVLAEADVRAICKNRGLPNQAASSRHLLENLFLSDAGVAVALRTLDRTEIALLHLLMENRRLWSPRTARATITSRMPATSASKSSSRRSVKWCLFVGDSV